MYCGAWVEISQPLFPIGTKTPIFITNLSFAGERTVAWRCILHVLCRAQRGFCKANASFKNVFVIIVLMKCGIFAIKKTD
ncbi:hypothetical protein ESA_02362 [Cronobacter sakazakii ATCC BAA-894]|uniref:Uncharacterized protein n=1 Tax=Cronobacter sakazakii (strain ATCC BAA-894) TaxID=290339 RepID=A7ME51_CROS8|nr:hypothetical protein ESA_02362 [Cronobacter sakazakii ATCC BAA-894]